jgi:hypothetical protein
MAILTKVITASVGFAFTLGGFGKASAEDAKVSKNGTVVLAKETRTPSMSTVDQLREQLTILAATKDGKTKGTKGTKTQTKSPKKPTKGKGKN